MKSYSVMEVNEIRADIFNKVKILVIILLLIPAVIISGNALSHLKKSDEEITYNLMIPTEEEILINGYPQNEFGETYGPSYPGNKLIPDLQLAEGVDGVLGYIRFSETPGSELSYDEVIEYAENSDELKTTLVPLYLQDGKTIIGYFRYN